MVWIVGTNFSDVLKGSNENDVIFGLAGNDTIEGFDGDDDLMGGYGLDSIMGGEGQDDIYGNEGNDTLYGGRGYDFLSGGDGDDQLYGGHQRDTLKGGFGEDTLDGGKLNDTVDYSDSTSMVIVNLDNGFAVSHATHGSVLVNGDQDLLISIERAIGSEHGDILLGTDERNVFHGGDGNDLIKGFGEHDQLHGGGGDDEIWGGDDDDYILPGLGNATVYGGEGRDTLDLRVEGDTVGWSIDLSTNSGSRIKPQFVFSDQTSDAAWVREPLSSEPETRAPETITIEPQWFDSPIKPINFELPGSYIPVDVFWHMHIEGIERLYGSNGNDTLRGDVSAEYINGSFGDDEIRGRGGNDTIIGAYGTDSLYGGAGNDTLIAVEAGDELNGGGGGDTFVFQSPNTLDGSAFGTVKDFTDGDTIDIFDFHNGASTPDFVGDGPFSGTGREVRIEQLFSSVTASIEIDSDGDGSADWTIDVIKTNPFDLMDGHDIVLT